MQIVTDSGTDLVMPPEQVAALGIHVIPLIVTLEGQTYREGVNLNAAEFYEHLAATDALPTTSQPSAGEFADVYRRLAASDPDILSIHISSGLSGTLNSARAGAQLVPEARVTHVDTKTLSAGAGWQVAACARAIKAGWPKERVVDLAARIGAATDTLFTIKELKYLIHGGRISHMKGLIASVLNLKPIIGVDKSDGTYHQRGQARSFKGAVRSLVDLMAAQYTPGSALRAQVVHSFDLEAAEMLREAVDERFTCTWLPTGLLSMVLGAHTGPTMVGVAYAPMEAFADMP